MQVRIIRTLLRLICIHIGLEDLLFSPMFLWKILHSNSMCPVDKDSIFHIETGNFVSWFHDSLTFACFPANPMFLKQRKASPPSQRLTEKGPSQNGSQQTIFSQTTESLAAVPCDLSCWFSVEGVAGSAGDVKKSLGFCLESLYSDKLAKSNPPLIATDLLTITTCWLKIPVLSLLAINQLNWTFMCGLGLSGLTLPEETSKEDCKWWLYDPQRAWQPIISANRLPRLQIATINN